MSNNSVDYKDLGKVLAEAIEDLEMQRKFAGDMECVFFIRLDDGSQYGVTVCRVAQETQL